MAYRDYSISKGFMVDGSGHGDFTTVQAAVTAASSGQTIFIRPGTYTENVTLKAGVDLASFGANPGSQTAISGTLTFSGTGSVSLFGIQVNTNSAPAITVSGSNASTLILQDCYIGCNNNTGITFSSSNASSVLNLINCNGDISTTGIAVFTHTSAGILQMSNTLFSNSGASTTASTISAGQLALYKCSFANPITSSGTAGIVSQYTSIQTTTNTTALTLNGSGTNGATNDLYASGSASGVVVTSGTANLVGCEINCSNTNAITGAGTLVYAACTFPNSSGINVTTVTSKTYFKSLLQVFTSSGTYTPTKGLVYCIIECVGGGGGGGGTASAGASQLAIGGGGGGGAYSRKYASAGTIGTSQTVTVGAAGTAGSSGNNAGGAGGASSLGAICTANGGSGGSGNTGTGAGVPGAGGTAGTGDFSVPGQTGGYTFPSLVTTYLGIGGYGGASLLGYGGIAQSGTPVAGNAGQNYGGGGSGGASNNANGAAAGGAGAAGIVIVTEFIL